MGECSCINIDFDRLATLLSDGFHIARKDHKCCECRESIKPGEKYYKEVTIADGSLETFKTCFDCFNVRNAFFCSWTWGSIWGDLWCEIVDSDGDISQTKIAELPKTAREKVCELIEKHWNVGDRR